MLAHEFKRWIYRHAFSRRTSGTLGRSDSRDIRKLFLPKSHQHVWIPTRGRNIFLLLLRTNSELIKRVDPTVTTVYVSTCEATAACKVFNNLYEDSQILSPPDRVVSELLLQKTESQICCICSASSCLARLATVYSGSFLS